MKKLLTILLSLALLCGPGFAEKNDDMYQQALKFMEAGDYLNAAEYFEALGDYRDSAKKAKEARSLRQGGKAKEDIRKETEDTRSSRARPRIGEHITFGHYEQDGNRKNGAEPIEWVVLDYDGNNLIMTSLYALEARPFHNSSTHATWENCDLRKWLANSFSPTAFSDRERAALRQHLVKAERNHWHPDYDPGNDTYDTIFLLSVHEFETYMLGFDPYALGITKKETRIRMDQLPVGALNRCKSTAYAREQGAKVKSGYCHWWLRSPGDGSKKAANVFTTGHYIEDHFKVTTASVCVRPVICVDAAMVIGA